MRTGWRPRRIGLLFGVALCVCVGAAWGQAEGAPASPETEEVHPLLRPADGAKPMNGERQAEPVYLDFEGVELGQVIKAIGAQTGKNFLYDPQVGTIPVTIVSHAPLNPDMLLQALQSILVANNFSMTETLDGNLIKITPIAENAPTDVHTDMDTLPGRYEEIFTYIVQVRYAKVEDLAKILPTLGSKAANVNKVDAYGPTNTLILTDNAFGIRNMLKFLRQVDIQGSELVMDMFVLQYARAEVLATQLQDVLLGADASDASPAGRVQIAPQRVRPPVPGQQEQAIVSAEEETLRIVPDARLNMLVVVATDTLMKQLRELINKLDVPTPPEANNIHVYQLQNADAEEVAEKLNAIIGGTAPRQEQQDGSAQASAEVQPFEKKVLVESYDATNSLIMVASPQDYRVLVEEFISPLDLPRRQVHVEAIIMEVVIQDRFELAVEASALTGNDGFALNNIVTLANILASGPLAAVGDSDSPSLTTGVLDGTMNIPVYGSDGSVTLQTVPKIPVLLTALDSVTDLDVLSQPLITTVDNEEASITIGDEVPITTGSSSSLNSATGSNVYQTIDREDVGIKLNVTPQISEGDNVLLTLEIEVSQTKESDVGADPNIVGPTLQKSNVQTPVVIRDGATGIVGGLISESTERTRRQTPYAGDLPVLGWLFRRKTDRRVKRNLVVLVTPHVIKEGVDTDRITGNRIQEFSKANLDCLFEDGFIRKTEKRQYMRNKYRPSVEKTKSFDQRGRFERGDVER